MTSQRKLEIWLAIMITMLMAVEGQRKDIKVVCYYTDWSVYYNTDYKFTPKDIDAHLCTHLIYAFARFTNDSISIEPYDNNQDIVNNGYKEYTGRKTLNPDLKTMISLGGYNEGSLRFSNLASNEIQRKLFAKNVIQFLRKHNFDGLDIDWQNPASRDYSRPEDKQNYVALLKTIKDEFLQESVTTGSSLLLLSMTLPQKLELASKGYDVKNLNRHVDWFNVVGYNFHTSYESKVDHHSPLYNIPIKTTDDNLNLNYTINYYLNAGASPEKLVMGVPTFGNTFTLTDSGSTAIGSSSEKPGRMGSSTRSNGYLAYFEICDLFLPKTESTTKNNTDDDDYEDESGEWKVVEQLPYAGPYAFKGDQWVCYDDVKSAAKKAEYVMENSLGGMMFWTIDNDDYRGKCHGEAFPIIRAAKRALLKSVGIIKKKKITASSIISTTIKHSVETEVTSTLSPIVIDITPNSKITTKNLKTNTNPEANLISSVPKEKLDQSSAISLSYKKSVSSGTSENSNSDLDKVKSINFRDMAKPNEPVTKFVELQNDQPPQIANLNDNDNSFDPNKSDKGLVYVNNIYISNLVLKFFK